MERSGSSPARTRPEVAANGVCDSPEDSRIASALSLLRGFDSTARIEAVVKHVDTTFVRMTPGSTSTGSTQLAAFTALKMAFPFSAVTAIDNAMTGETQIHLLLSSNEIAVKHAKDYYATTRVFKLLDRASNAFLATSVLTFAILLQASLSAK
jgi:hypothetical protein